MLERRHVRQASFWFAIVLIAATSLLAYRGLQALLTVSSSVDETRSILLQLEDVNSLLKDAEIGQRGFIITGDERQLEPYRNISAQSASALRRLRDLTAANPTLRAAVSRLEPLVTEHLSALSRNQANESASLDSASIQRSQELMDRIRAEISGMTEEGRRQLDANEQEARRRAHMAILALAIGTAISCAAIIFIFTMMSSEVRRRRHLESRMAELNAKLKGRVAQRTGELAEANQALLQESGQRRRTTEELRESNDRLSAIIGASPFAIELLDAEGKVALWNAGAARIFGYESREVVGRPPPFSIDEQAIAAVDAGLDRSRPLEGVYLDLPHRTGKTVHVRLFAAAIAPQEGNREVLYVMEDLTERREIEQQLRQSQKMEVIGQLTGGIAHDFNNLLTIILGNLDIAQEKLTPGTEPGENVQTAIKSALRGADLTQRLLAFARKQALQPRIINLNELLSGTTAMLKRMLGETVTVSLLLDDHLWPAMVDPSQVEDALLNMAVNARDAMPHGGRMIIETANVTLDEDYIAFNPGLVPGDYVMLSVGDTGIGISPENLERVFEPFFTTKEKGKGTGLGLSMIYGFVKQSGGHIKIYSEPGHGTTIRIYLPRVRSGAPAETAAAPAAPVPPTPVGKTVLVVEDTPDVRDLAVRMLNDLGYSVIEASMPDEALEVLRGPETIDILFTDVVLPGKRTGYELAMQAKDIRPQLRILFTSGYSEVFIKQGAGDVRAQLISKPYRKQDLAAKLRNALADEDA